MRTLLDTLAKAEIVDGKFEFKGNVDAPIMANFAVEGISSRNEIAFFLENVNIVANLDLVSFIDNDVQGGPEQQAYLEYTSLRRELYRYKDVAFQKIHEAKNKEEADSLQQEFSKAWKNIQTGESKFIQSHPDAAISAFIIWTGIDLYTLEFSKKRFDMLSEKGKSTYYGKEVSKKIALKERTDIEATAPNFTVNGPEGKPFSMYDVKTSKYKLVLFWTLEDEEQAALQNKTMRELYDLYHDRGLEIVSVCGSKDVEAWKKMVWDGKFSWRAGIVTDNSVSELYGLEKRFLNVYVLDENNKIVLKGKGGELLKSYMERLYEEGNS